MVEFKAIYFDMGVQKGYYFALVMGPLIPEFVDYAQKAEQAAEITGVWPLKRLNRLKESLLSDEGEVDVRFRFSKQNRLRILECEARVQLALRCERCMQAMPYGLETHFQVALVASEAEARQMPDDMEYLVMEAKEVNLPELLEDELILALPLVPMHQHDCSEYLNQQRTEQDNASGDDKSAKENPFSVLKDLL